MGSVPPKSSEEIITEKTAICGSFTVGAVLEKRSVVVCTQGDDEKAVSALILSVDASVDLIAGVQDMLRRIAADYARKKIGEKTDLVPIVGLKATGFRLDKMLTGHIMLSLYEQDTTLAAIQLDPASIRILISGLTEALEDLESEQNKAH